MPENEGLIDDLAGAILDGAPIDWASAASSAELADRPLLDELQLLAALATIHRQPTRCWPEVAERQRAAVAGNDRVEILEQWGHLRVLERIGRGVFGDVYRAWDTRLDREVALKLMPVSRSTSDPRGTSIIEEGRLLARVRHPNVVTIYGAERIENRIGLWMELVKGRTLQQALEQGNTFSAAKAIAIGLELARAIGAVHEAGLVHRDIKPHNVMLAEDGRVVLMDFGTGHELDEGSRPALAGTPLYLAPELLNGHALTVRSDVYSFGVLLFHLLTGSYPVHGQSLRDLRLAHETRVTKDVRSARPDVSPKLARIIERAIDPRPERRYESTAAITTELASLQPRPGRVRFAYEWAVAAMVLLAVTTWEVRGRQVGSPNTPIALLARVTGAAPLSHPERANSTTPIRSIAVLPFKPLVATEADERLQLGMTEAVINQLSRIETVRIEPLARVRRFSAIDQDPLEAGRALGVDAVVDGHFQQTDQGVQVRMRLVRTLDGIALATNQWHEPFKNILNVQTRLAELLAEALALTLTPAERARIRTQDTNSPDAFRHYMFGRSHMEVRNFQRMISAEREFSEALRLDPNYARAHAAMSLTLIQMAWLAGRSGIDVKDAAKEAALKALALDESVALAHSALAQIHAYFEYDPIRAQTEHLRAMELDAQDVWVLRGYESFLQHHEAFDEALEVNARLLALDPTSAYSNRLRATILYSARRYDECVAVCRRTLSLDPDDLALSHQWLARCLEQQGRRTEAIDAWTNHQAAHGDAALAKQRKALYATKGWEVYWRERLRLAGSLNVSAAAAHLRLGNVDEAMQNLEHAYDERNPWVGNTHHPEWDLVRADPRFRAVRLRAGLTDQMNVELARLRGAARRSAVR